MKPDPWWVRLGPTLAGALIFVGPILVLVAIAAIADAPVFAAVAIVGVVAVLTLRKSSAVKRGRSPK